MTARNVESRDVDVMDWQNEQTGSPKTQAEASAAKDAEGCEGYRENGELTT